MGPRRVTQGEIRAAFVEGWKVEWIRPAGFETRIDGHEARAWLASITKEAEARADAAEDAA